MFTIISVSFRSRKLLELNYDLVKFLNPGVKLRWIVVQNTPENELHEDLQMDDSRFEVIKGPVITKMEASSIGYGSFHHAKALNLAISYTDADKFLILDPDCFMLLPDWIRLVEKHMDQMHLGFFGAPYHPKKVQNYKEFPSAICMFINRKLLEDNHHFFLDFSPDMSHRFYARNYYCALEGTLNCKMGRYFLFGSQEAPLRWADGPLLLQVWLQRKFPQLFPNFYRDTGFRIYGYYYNCIPHEVLDVVAKDSRKLSTKVFEALLPNYCRTFPRLGKGIIEEASPLTQSLPNFCEEFHWQGQLFALHVGAASYNETIKKNCMSILEHLRSIIPKLITTN